MVKVLSLSGGKTSAYIYANYHQDLSLFALVTNEEPLCAHPDKGVWREVQDKCGKEVIGTPEHPDTVKVVLDLEQKYGKPIKWLVGDTFEKVIKNHSNALPNQNQRFCTQDMKLKPIFQHCYFNHEFVTMQIGYRYDEKERAERATTESRYPIHSNNYGTRRRKWKEVTWRDLEFPLIEDRVDHYQVAQFWKGKDIVFPKDSNCQMCFWKHPMQLRKNYDDAPNVMQWAKEMEARTGRRFLHKMTMEQVEKIAPQLDFFYGGGSGCSAGFCTD